MPTDRSSARPSACRRVRRGERTMAATTHRSRPRGQRSASPKPMARIDVRLSDERKALLQHAADLEGRTLSDFILSTAQERAERTIREHEVLTLSVRDSHAFVEALLNPPAPSDRLRLAAQRYREF